MMISHQAVNPKCEQKVLVWAAVAHRIKDAKGTLCHLYWAISYDGLLAKTPAKNAARKPRNAALYTYDTPAAAIEAVPTLCASRDGEACRKDCRTEGR